MERMNDGSVWRAFDDAELTHSAAHYLMAVMHLREEFGYARVTDVAEYLKVSRGAASRAVAMLKERNWLEEDPHRMLLMTEDGLELARSVERNFRIAEQFFEDILGVPSEIAREDACKLEHLISNVTTEALFNMLRALHDNPKLLKSLKTALAETSGPCAPKSECPVCGSDGTECLGNTPTEQAEKK